MNLVPFDAANWNLCVELLDLLTDRFDFVDVHWFSFCLFSQALASAKAKFICAVVALLNAPSSASLSSIK